MTTEIQPRNFEIAIIDLVKEHLGGFADEIEVDGQKFYVDVDAEVSQYDEDGGAWAPDYSVYTLDDICLNCVYALDDDGNELEDVEVVVDESEFDRAIGDEF